MTRYDYEKVVKLKHNQIPARIDIDTGEVKALKSRELPEKYKDTELWEPEKTFRKVYNSGWVFLQKVLTPIQLKAALYLSLKAAPYSNSLEPLSDETTYKELSELTGIGINQVSKTFKTLFSFGVYAKMRIVENSQEKEYWVFNPYLSFNGRRIEKGLMDLFKNTDIAKVVRK